MGSNPAHPDCWYGKCRCPVSGLVGVTCVRGWGRLGHSQHPVLAEFGELFRRSAAIQTWPAAPVLHKVQRDTWGRPGETTCA